MILLLTLFLSSIQAQSQVSVSEVSNDNKVIRSSIVNSIQLRFIPIPGLPTKKLVYSGSFDTQKKISNISSSNDTSKISLNNTSVNVEFLGLKEELNSNEQVPQKYVLTPVYSSNKLAILYDNCKNSFIKIQIKKVDPKSVDLNFPIGLSCGKVNDRQAIALSLPFNYDWVDGTLFETSGKGETWRHYELPSTENIKGLIGSIKISFDNKEYIIEILTTRVSSSDSKEKMALENPKNYFISSFKFDFQNKNTGFNASSVSYNTSSLSFNFGVLTNKLYKSLALSLDYSGSLGVSENSEKIKMTDLTGQLNYIFSVKSYHLIPYLYGKSSDYVHSPSKTRFQANFAGVGHLAYYNITKHLISLDLKYGVFFPVNVKGHLSYDLSYSYLIKKELNLFLGVGLSSQNFNVVNSNSESREFKDSSIYFRVLTFAL